MTVVLSALLVALTWGQSPEDARMTRRQEISAMREGGVRAAAKVTGRFVSAMEFDAPFFEKDLRSLFRNSDTVVSGVALSNRCIVSRDGSTIVTEYKVAVDRQFKGHHPSAYLTVILPGGRVSFEDGSTAEIRTPGFKKMENSKRYLLFLEERKDGSEGYALRAGPQGILEISSEGMNPLTRKEFPVHRELKGKDEQATIQEIERLQRAEEQVPKSRGNN